MTRINLLPLRATLRSELQRQFVSVAAGAAVLMIVIVLYAHIHMANLIGTQENRNKFLEDEIKKVEATIEEIKGIEGEKEKLLARMNIIQQLQRRRPEIVHLFDEFQGSVPEGIYLTSMKQTGTSVVIEGIAQSNTRISTFMKNLDSSDWLVKTKLLEIEAKDKARARTSRFKLHVQQVTLDTESAEDEGAN